MRWLVTGGCGFIGINLIRRLIADGVSSIRIVDNLSVGSREDLASVTDFVEVTPDDISATTGRVELVVKDILDQEVARTICADVQVIVHLAANTGVGPSVEDPMRDCKVNVIGTLNYLEGARLQSVPRFIFASSGAPVGEVDPPIHEDIVPKPASPYGSSKLAGEGYCSSYFRCFGLETVSLRFGNVYGPGSKKKESVVAKFFKKTMSGEPIEIYGDGSQTRDFIYIDDLVLAVILSGTTVGVGGEVFQIATSEETTVGELSKLVLSVVKERGTDVPEIIRSEERAGDVMRNYSDTTKARIQLGWKSEISLREGLKTTYSYFLNR